MFAEKLLAIKGYSHEAIKDILSDDLINCPHFFDIHNNEKNIENVRQYFRIRKYFNDLIVIHGDYDVDGLTGSSIIYKFLKSNGYNCLCFIPTRDDGYGLSDAAVQKYIDMGARVVITSDCGISNIDEANILFMAGVDLIITDHHTPKTTIPTARFIFHPKITSDTSIVDFSGAGMAYYFCSYVNGSRQKMPELLDFVALGMVGDMVPLRDESFIIAKQGLHFLRNTTNIGLIVLIKECGLNKSTLSSDDLNFQIIPRLNAAGRMDSPQIAFNLLFEEDVKKAALIAKQLTILNNKRKEECEKVYLEITNRIEKEGFEGAIVFADENWHHGILGIICARLVEEFDAPAYIMQIKDGIAKGSARGPKWFNVLASLHRASKTMTKYGGHPAAGGFSLNEENIDEFERQINGYVNDNDDFFLDADDIVTFPITVNYISRRLYDDVSRLEPFSIGNSKPLFFVENVKINGVPDKKNKHLFANISIGGSSDLRVMGWNMWSDEFYGKQNVDISFFLCLNKWRGKEELCLQINTITKVQGVNQDDELLALF